MVAASESREEHWLKLTFQSKRKHILFFPGLSHMLRVYVEAINTPGAIPNFEDAWNVSVKKICADAKEAAMRKYSAIMMSELKGRLPLDGGDIRKSHDAAFEECQNEVMVQTKGLLTNTVEDCLDEFKVR